MQVYRSWHTDRNLTTAKDFARRVTGFVLQEQRGELLYRGQRITPGNHKHIEQPIIKIGIWCYLHHIGIPTCIGYNHLPCFTLPVGVSPTASTMHPHLNRKYMLLR